MKIPLTIALIFFTIKLPLTDLRLEVSFLIFTIFFFVFSVFFEQKNDKKEYKHGEILIFIGMVTYTCLFLYYTDFSVLELLSLVIFMLSYPANYFYSKNKASKIKKGNKS